MFGNSDDIRKETKNKTENEPCYGGFGGRFSYEMFRSKNRTARLAEIIRKAATLLFACIFFGSLGVLAGLMIYQVIGGNFVPTPAVEESMLAGSLSDSAKPSDTLEQISVTSNGAEMVSVTKEFSDRYRIPMGVLIKELSKENIGYDAGVREGDIVVMIGGKEVLGTEWLSDLADAFGTEDSVSVRVFRDGEYHDFVVEMD